MIDLKKVDSLKLALDILQSEHVRSRYNKTGYQSDDGTITATYASDCELFKIYEAYLADSKNTENGTLIGVEAEQGLEAGKEERMKIDWSKLHQDAQWAAMDFNGYWWGYRTKPSREMFSWSDDSPISLNDQHCIRDVDVNWSEGSPWFATRTMRPESYTAQTYNTPDGEPPFDPPPASADRAIRTVLEVIRDLKVLKREELDSPISSLKTAIFRLSDKL